MTFCHCFTLHIEVRTRGQENLAGGETISAKRKSGINCRLRHLTRQGLDEASIRVLEFDSGWSARRHSI